MKRRILIMTMAASMIVGQMAAPISVLAKENTSSVNYQMMYHESFGEVPNTRIPCSWGDTMEVFFKPEDGSTENWHGCKAGDRVKPDSWFVDFVEGAKNNWTKPYNDRLVGWRSTLDGKIYTTDNIPAVTAPVSYYAVFESSLNGNEQFGGSNDYQPTQAPATQAPQTQAPQTQAPQTQAPQIQAPQTQAPQTQAPQTQAPATQAPQTQAPATQVPLQRPGAAYDTRLVAISATKALDLKDVTVLSGNTVMLPRFSAASGAIRSVAADSMGNLYVITSASNVCVISKYVVDKSQGKVLLVEQISLLDSCYDVAVDKISNQIYASSGTKIYEVDFNNHTVTTVADLSSQLANNSTIAGVAVDNLHNRFMVTNNGELYRLDSANQIVSMGSFGGRNIKDMEYYKHAFYILFEDDTDASAINLAKFDYDFSSHAVFKLSNLDNQMPISLGEVTEEAFTCMPAIGTYGYGKGNVGALTPSITNIHPNGPGVVPATQAPQTQAPATQAPQTQAPQTQAPATQVPQAPQTQNPSAVDEARLVAMSDINICDFSNLTQTSGDIYGALHMGAKNGIMRSMSSDTEGNIYTITYYPSACMVNKYTMDATSGSYKLDDQISLLDSCYDVSVDRKRNQVYISSRTKVYEVDFSRHITTEVANLSSNLTNNSMIAGITIDKLKNIFIVTNNGDLFRVDSANQVISMGTLGVKNVIDFEFYDGYFYALAQDENDPSALKVAMYYYDFSLISAYKVSGYGAMMPTSLGILPVDLSSATAVISQYSIAKGNMANVVPNITNLHAQKPVITPDLIPTQAPATQAPATQAPQTQAPATQAPATQAPQTQAPATQAPQTQAPQTQAPATQAPQTQAPTQAPQVPQISDDGYRVVGLSNTTVYDISGLNGTSGDTSMLFKLNPNPVLMLGTATDAAGNMYVISTTKGSNTTTISMYADNQAAGNGYVAQKSVQLAGECTDIIVNRATNQVYVSTAADVYKVDFNNQTTTPIVAFRDFVGPRKAMIAGMTLDENQNIVVIANDGVLLRCDASDHVQRIGSLGTSNIYDIERLGDKYYVLIADAKNPDKATINIYTSSFQPFMAYNINSLTGLMPTKLTVVSEAEYARMIRGQKYTSTRGTMPTSTNMVSDAPADTTATRLIGVGRNYTYDLGDYHTVNGNILNTLQSNVSYGFPESMASDANGNVYAISHYPSRCVLTKLVPNAALGKYEVADQFTLLDPCKDVIVNKYTNQLYVTSDTKVYAVDMASHAATVVADLTASLANKGTIAGATVDVNQNFVIITTTGDLFRLDGANQIISMGTSGAKNVSDIEYRDAYFYVLCADPADTTAVTVMEYTADFKLRTSIKVMNDGKAAPTSICNISEHAMNYFTITGHYTTGKGDMTIVSNVTNLPVQGPTGRPAQTPTQAPATQTPATQAPATQTPATQAPATQAPVADGTSIVTSYGTWISGSYHRSDVSLTADPTRLCLATPIVGRTGDKYTFNLKDSNLEVIVRAVNPDGTVDTYTGRNGSYLPTETGVTYYIIIKSYRAGQTFDAYQTAMARDPEYINIIKK